MQHQKIYVLDTNVLLSDPRSIYSFQEHHIHIPFIVLEELDSKKIGHSELAMNARETTRQLEQITRNEIRPNLYRINDQGGTLSFTTQELKNSIPSNPSNDNLIIAETQSLQALHRDQEVILISRDLNMRVKAKSLLIHTEDYLTDQVIDDSDFINNGYKLLPENTFTENTVQRLIQVYNAHKAETIKIPATLAISEHDIFAIEGTECSFRCLEAYDDYLEIEPLNAYIGKNSVWGVRAKNNEQNVALNLLMDPDKHLVVVSGQAGSGKTILSLAAALESVIENKQYEKIIFMRETMVAGDAEEIGFLPGTEFDKVINYLGALTENLRQLNGFDQPKGNKNKSDAPMSPLGQFENVIEIKSIGLQRGTSYKNSFIILDEAQNISQNLMKMLLTRAGEGSKIVLLGNVAQIDSPYLSQSNNGMINTIKAFDGCDIFGHVILKHTVRSRLAEEAVKRLNG